MIHCILFSLIAFASADLLATEIAALCSLTTTLTGFPASWDCSSANVTTHCTWPGVLCTANGLTVQSIDLSAFTLTGTIPSLVWSLEAFTSFILTGSTGVTGTIPLALGDTNTLQNLNLSSLSLTGTIPQTIANIVSLLTLDLSKNQLSGLIPSDIYQCTYLNFMDVSQNLFAGQLPDMSSLPIARLNVKNTKIDGCFPRGLEDTLTSCDASTSSFYCDCPAPALCSSLPCCYIVTGLEQSNLRCSNGVYTSTGGQALVSTLTVAIPPTQSVNITNDMAITTSLAISSGSLNLQGNVVIRSSSTLVLSLGSEISQSGGCIDISNANLRIYINGASVTNGTSFPIILSSCVNGEFNNTEVLDSNCYTVNAVVSPLGVSVSFTARPCAQPLSTEAILAIVFCILILIGSILFAIYYFMNPDLQEHVFQTSDEKESMILQNKFNPPTTRDVEFV